MSDYQSNQNQPFQPGQRPPEQQAPYGAEVPNSGATPPPNQPYPQYVSQQQWTGQYPPPPPGPPNKGIPWWGFVLGGCGCVVLLIPIMAAILFPVFSQARTAARAASCLSNEKQMGLAALMYAQDYDEVLPPSAEWITMLQPYVNSSSNTRTRSRDYVFHCPEVSHRNPDIFGYAYNSDMNRKPLEKIAIPRSTLLIYDSATLSSSATDAITSLPSPGRHRRHNQAVFADGHAARLAGAGLAEFNSSGGQ